MIVLGTKTAFKKMISIRGVYKELNLHRSTVNNLKRSMYNKKMNQPSLDLMEDLLIKYGAKVVKEKKWKL